MATTNSPYSTTFASGDIQFSQLNPSRQMAKYKQEEKDARAPNTLPFEFGPLPELYANIVDNAFETYKILTDVLKMEQYEGEKDLEKLALASEKIVKFLMENVDKTLEKYTIGAYHIEDDD
jgi:hypothetical protein